MIIDFSQIEEAVLKNFRGGEKDTNSKAFTDDLNNRIMYNRLESGASIGFHKHENDSEIVYIVKGCGKAIYDDEHKDIQAGVCHYCPKGHSHSLINNSNQDLEFFAVIVQQ